MVAGRYRYLNDVPLGHGTLNLHGKIDSNVLHVHFFNAAPETEVSVHRFTAVKLKKQRHFRFFRGLEV